VKVRKGNPKGNITKLIVGGTDRKLAIMVLSLNPDLAHFENGTTGSP